MIGSLMGSTTEDLTNQWGVNSQEELISWEAFAGSILYSMAIIGHGRSANP